MAAPLAYFLTWTTYGTRLHGDSRGTVDEAHNRLGQPRIAPNAERQARSRRKLIQPPYTLSPEAQNIVLSVIRTHSDFRGWRLHAVATPRTHVHVVVDCRVSGESRTKPPETVMKEYKSWATRELRRLDLAGPDRRIWTDHGSTRWLNHASSVEAAIDYVSRLQ